MRRPRRTVRAAKAALTPADRPFGDRTFTHRLALRLAVMVNPNYGAHFHGDIMRMFKTLVQFTSLLSILALATPALADHHTVKIAKNETLGRYLTDAKGMTLYVFKKDSPGKSSCAGDCVTRWPLYFREDVGVAGDLKASDFGTITREDGQKQTTYKGLPLYYFAADKAPGDTKGQAVKDVWFAATP
jgi:predicted lipoprotein with Yx(FWY)xxD motif